MKPIYKPKGRAKEYGELAINIYDSCNHGCTYCWARPMAARFGKPWTGNVTPREGIVGAVERQISKEKITGQLIHLCFTCDPYPADIDTSTTREVIKVIKATGNYVQILTKGGRRAERDFDLLDGGDWFGVTFTNEINRDYIVSVYEASAYEPGAAVLATRLCVLQAAKRAGIKTWASCEPVLAAKPVYRLIKHADYIDLYKIGKLNYGKSDIDWGEFGRECERLCVEYGRNYYLKQDLRDEMRKGGAV